MSERLRAEGDGPLLEFLAERLAGWHKRTLRQRLKLGCVRVNGAVVKRNGQSRRRDSFGKAE